MLDVLARSMSPGGSIGMAGVGRRAGIERYPMPEDGRGGIAERGKKGNESMAATGYKWTNCAEIISQRGSLRIWE